MKKSLMLCLIVVSLFAIKSIDAANTYERLSDGSYRFCVDGVCETATTNEENFGTISGNNIIRNGVTYSSINSATTTEPNTSTQTPTTSEPVYSNPNGPCTKLKEPLKFIGHIVFLIKIIIPIALIVFGMIDLFKSITNGKDSDFSKVLKSLLFRIVAGICIFFIPTVISYIFSLVDGFDEVESEFDVCQKCILNVSSCDGATSTTTTTTNPDLPPTGTNQTGGVQAPNGYVEQLQ